MSFILVDERDVAAAANNLNNLGRSLQEDRHRETTELLGDLRTAKFYLRKRDIAWLEGVKETIEDVLLKKKEQAQKDSEEREKARKAKEDAINEIKAYMLSFDVSVNDIAHFKIKGKRGGYGGRPFTIRHHCHIFGRDYYWTGAGKTPKPFLCFVAKGNALESCALTPEQYFTTKKRPSISIPGPFQLEAEELLMNHRKCCQKADK